MTIAMSWEGRGKAFANANYVVNDETATDEEKEHFGHLLHLAEHWCEENPEEQIHLSVTGSAHVTLLEDGSEDHTRWGAINVSTTHNVVPEFITTDATHDPNVKRSLYVYGGYGTPNQEVWLRSPLVTDDGRNHPIYYLAEDEYGPDREPTTKGAKYEAAFWYLYTGEYKWDES